MTINELNKLLIEKKPDGVAKAELKDNGETLFMDKDGTHRVVLNTSNYWEIITTSVLTVNDDFFRVVAPYVDTPVKERKSETKYMVPIALHSGLGLCYSKLGKAYALVSIGNGNDVPDFCKFTRDELDDLYSDLRKECGKHYECVAETATIDANLYKGLL